MSVEPFHPIIQTWFRRRFSQSTPPQSAGWPVISRGSHTLIAAPTGSGKTLTAFLAAIDQLVRAGLENRLPEEMQVIYVSPLRALSNDMQRNLVGPLQEIQELAEELGEPIPALRVGLRTGDSSSSQRAALIRRPPHILVTTPESLFLMLGSEGGRRRLKTVRTVIVDEIHALVRDKRGSHLSLSLERLSALCPHRVQRIGLSATQRPMDRIAQFLVGCEPSETPAESVSPEISTSPEEHGSPASRQVQSQAVQSQGAGPQCEVIDVGHQRDLDLGIELPPSELGAVCSNEQWSEVYERLCELILSHRSTLVFVNTRRMAERIAHRLTERLGPEAVSSHHGSLATELRHDTEQRLKTGRLRAVVATASLELGLDVGFVDLVVQIGSPRSIAVFLQRVGRSGHALGLVPKGRLFALTRDELIESLALLRAVRHGRLDVIPIPVAPLDILAQQIVAEVGAREWATDELYALLRRAAPYRDLPRQRFDEIVALLSEGLTPGQGRGRVFLHHDQVQKRLRPRPGARLAAALGAGAIPDLAAYRVLLEPDHVMVGTVDEHFAVESQAGDVFLLGNSSWRIQGIRGSDVLVNDAQGAAPTIPFWEGEAPGRTFELSTEVSELRAAIDQHLQNGSLSAPSSSTAKTAAADVDIRTGFLTDSGDARVASDSKESSNSREDAASQAVPASLEDSASLRAAQDWLQQETGADERAVRVALEYCASQRAALGLLPHQKRIVFERFFDESGGMQLVIHAPFGSRIMRAWGLAMRKRFCRSFNFELQATADDDGLVLSMGPQHSFPLESLFSMLNERNARHLLEQALLAVPIFLTRWRWNITRSLLVARSKNGKKVPPALLRFRADDLLSAVFPQATGCLENSPGDVEIPDHPLVQQTMHDSLQEALDLEGLLGVLRQISQGEIELLARDTREPSPFCYELLNANPYAFLDGGEANERRSRAVATRRTLSAEELRDSGQLDLEAIRQVVQEARPLVRNPDELHDILLSRYLLPSEPAEPFAALDSAAAGSSLADAQDNALRPLREQPDWQPWLLALQSDQRAARVTWGAGHSGWVSAERWWAVKKRFPDAQLLGPLAELPPPDPELTEEQILVTLVRGVIEVCGPVTAAEIAAELGLAEKTIFAALEAIEGEGLVLRGRYRNAPSWHAPAVSPEPPIEWCHRRLLARIHRLTLDGLRRQIEPVDIATFVRFLARHHALMPGTRRAGKNGVLETIQQLQGLDMAASAWEREILPPRCENYRAESLDELCLSGEVGWSRLYPRPRLPDRARPISGIAKVCPVSLYCRDDLTWLRGDRPRVDGSDLSSPAQQIMELLLAQGAMFAADIGRACRMLPSHLTEALGELVAGGWVTSDTMVGLRALVTPAKSKSHGRASYQQTQSRVPLAGAGRWSLNWSHWPPSGNAGASSPTSSAITSARAAAARSPLAKDAVPASGVPDSGASTPDEFATGELLPTAVESWAWLLLRRWGIVFWDLLEREPGAPRWSEVVAVYRRLEARGEIRGGRFVTGVGGEQYALPHVVSQLRQLRDQGPVGEILIVSAVDPLNVVGLGNKQDRVPRRPGLKVVYLDGAPVAIISKGEVEWLGPPSARVAALLEKASRGKLKLRKAQSTAAQVAVNAATAKRPPDDTDQPADSGTGAEKKRPKRRRPKPTQKPRQRWLFG